MVDFKLVNAYSSMLFANDGYQVVVMPLMTPKATEAMERDRQAKNQAEAPAETEAPAEAEVIAKAEEIVTKVKKPKRSRKREPVAVA
jgi:hypothetical protein